MAGASGSNGKGRRPAPAPVDVGSPLLDWEEGDHFSFEDSERFEEDSLCSWSSEPESLCNNWRGWKRPNAQNPFIARPTKKPVQGKRNWWSFVSKSSNVVFRFIFSVLVVFFYWITCILCHEFVILLLGHLKWKFCSADTYTYILLHVRVTMYKEQVL